MRIRKSRALSRIHSFCRPPFIDCYHRFTLQRPLISNTQKLQLGSSFLPIFAGVHDHSSLSPVALDVEVDEESQSQTSLGQRDERQVPRVAAVVEERDGHVHHEADKLGDLQLGEVALPPQVLLHLGTDGGEEVVGVHDDVHDGVHADSEDGMAVAAEVQEQPAAEHDQKVVDDVEERDLRVLLAKDEEHGVHEVGDPDEAVPPGQPQDGHVCLCRRAVVDALAEEVVLTAEVRQRQQAHGEVRVGEHREGVVQQYGPLEVVRLAVLHPAGSGELGEVHVPDEQREDEPRVRREAPSLGARVPVRREDLGDVREGGRYC